VISTRIDTAPGTEANHVLIADDPSQAGPGEDAARGEVEAAAARRERQRDYAVVALPTALAFVLCLYHIGGRSLSLDEAASVTIAGQHGGAFGAAVAHDGGNMSGYYALLHVLIRLFGDGTLVVRLPSAVAAAAAVALVGVLALRLFDRQVALAAGLLSAMSLPLVFWGQSARGYAPMVAFVVASWLAFVTLVDSSRDKRRRAAAWLAYVLATTLAIYMSLVAILVVPAQLLALLWLRRSVRPVVSALLLSAVLCAPLAVLAAERGSGQLFWVPRPGLTGEKQVLQSLASAALEPNFHATSTSGALLIASAILLIAAAAVVLRAVRGGRDAWGPLLLLSWLVVPVALAWLESLVGQPIFLPRNLLVSLPAAALLVAWVTVGGPVPRPVGWALVAAVIALRALQLAPSYDTSPENWKAASAYVVAHAGPGDCVAFYPSDGRMAFSYYLGSSAASRAPRPVLPAASWTTKRAYVEDYATLTRAELPKLVAGCRRLWLVAGHRGQPGGPSASRSDYARYLQLRAGLATRYPEQRGASFGYAPPVQVQLFARGGRSGA
jgi:mannosyltransferase